jgi:hypothetical protein
MPKITIHRRGEWSLKFGYMRIYEIFLDGRRIGYLPHGETNEFEVTPGEHKLRIKAGWFGSREHRFNIFGKETKTFTVSSMNNYTAIAAILVVIVIEFFRFAHWSKKLTHILLGAFFAVVIGFQIFGRNTYIIIREKH